MTVKTSESRYTSNRMEAGSADYLISSSIHNATQRERTSWDTGNDPALQVFERESGQVFADSLVLRDFYPCQGLPSKVYANELVAYEAQD